MRARTPSVAHPRGAPGRARPPPAEDGAAAPDGAPDGAPGGAPAVERAGPPRTTFEGVRARRPAPGLARAAVWIAVLCTAVPFVPALLTPGAPAGASAASASASPLLAATRDAAAVWLTLAAACLAGAWVAARGVARTVTVALDSRCLYVAHPRIERRIPRWMIEDAAARAPGTSGRAPGASGRAPGTSGGARLASSASARREVVLQASSGGVYIFVFQTADQARRLVDALRPAASGGGRRADSRLPARARTT